MIRRLTVARYKQIQIADLICTLKLIEKKFACGMAMSKSELKFFGGKQSFGIMSCVSSSGRKSPNRL